MSFVEWINFVASILTIIVVLSVPKFVRSLRFRRLAEIERELARIDAEEEEAANAVEERVKLVSRLADQVREAVASNVELELTRFR